MAASIGLRIYRTFITKEGDPTPVPFTQGQELADPYVFIHKYFTDKDLIISDGDIQRSWYISALDYADATKRNYYGLFSYGIYGFESTLVDTKTKKTIHERKIHEAEQIPLCFHVWAPTDVNWSYISFQSFQARSCVTVVQHAIARAFEKTHPGHRIRFVKISPGDGEGKSLFDKSVKEVHLIKKTNPTDLADVYSGKVKISEANLRLTIQAPRNRVLGMFSDVSEFFKGETQADGGSVVTFDGQEYDQAVAQVMFGKKRRMVGIVGYSNDAGVIDITQEVKYGKGGHPRADSVFKESNDIFVEMHSILKNRK